MDQQHHPLSIEKIKEIEQQAQQYWNEQQCFQVTEDDSKEKFYCLAMFPYPSGKLHMGHVRNYTITDVIARFQRMQGKNVLHPMGWDAFGLPAENAAIQNKTAPAKWTYSNIEYMKTQLKSLGFGFDWSRELATCQPDYYRWEQWFFTRLYEKGLVYKKMATVNWDPIDQTVLANEQVIDGKGWRSGAVVERKEIPQWFIKITDYADQLLNDLDKLPEWPEQVKTMQRNWIGKSRGVEMTFDLAESVAEHSSFDIYTTRPDTLMGVTYVSLAAEHPISLKLSESNSNLAQFIESCKTQSVAEADMAVMPKRGVDTGIKAVHPITGKNVPVWVANYVLMDYGSGAVMAVPAHDERDYEFAKKYGLDIQQVIAPTPDKKGNTDKSVDISKAAYTDKGILINSGVGFEQFDGLNFKKGFDAIAKHLYDNGKGKTVSNYRLRDWGVSRQRYWGSPIPMLNLPEGGEIPVPLEKLPVLLPEDVEMDGVQSPIKADKEWRKAEWHSQGAEHETDTFDTFMESSWYYARYTCAQFTDGMLDKDAADYWLPVDQYVGGIEHAILHLLYARFFHKLMRDEGLLSSDEPFKKLLCQGMVLADSFYTEQSNGKKDWYNPADVDLEKDDKGKVLSAKLKSSGEVLQLGGITKMSKSKNNGIDPQIAVEKYGADTVRLFTMFAAPPEQTLEWHDSGVEGASRFLNKLWNFFNDSEILFGIKAGNKNISNYDIYNDSSESTLDNWRAVNEILKQANIDMEKQQFNTVVSSCMKILNLISVFRSTTSQDSTEINIGQHIALLKASSILLRLLAPIAPHITHTLWDSLGFGENILDAAWPEVEEKSLIRSSIEMVVQINGKVRGKIQTAVDIEQADLMEQAQQLDNIQRFLEGKTVRKVIHIPNKLLNIVVG